MYDSKAKKVVIVPVQPYSHISHRHNDHHHPRYNHAHLHNHLKINCHVDQHHHLDNQTHLDNHNVHCHNDHHLDNHNIQCQVAIDHVEQQSDMAPHFRVGWGRCVVFWSKK